MSALKIRASMFPEQKTALDAAYQASLEEASVARIYGGLHYRNSTMVGKAMGKKIGELACQNYLKPVR
jgi:hypothetical protein